MKYKLADEALTAYQEFRVLAVITSASSRGVEVDEKEISIELGMSKDMTKTVLAKLIAENKIEEASDIQGLSPVT